MQQSSPAEFELIDAVHNTFLTKLQIFYKENWKKMYILILDQYLSNKSTFEKK